MSRISMIGDLRYPRDLLHRDRLTKWTSVVNQMFYRDRDCERFYVNIIFLIELILKVTNTNEDFHHTNQYNYANKIIESNLFYLCLIEHKNIEHRY